MFSIYFRLVFATHCPQNALCKQTKAKFLPLGADAAAALINLATFFTTTEKVFMLLK
jgi:hypothetical protein